VVAPRHDAPREPAWFDPFHRHERTVAPAAPRSTRMSWLRYCGRDALPQDRRLPTLFPDDPECEGANRCFRRTAK
jgi:hypothetical protein